MRGTPAAHIPATLIGKQYVLRSKILSKILVRLVVATPCDLPERSSK